MISAPNGGFFRAQPPSTRLRTLVRSRVESRAFTRFILVAAEESGEMFDDEPVELGRDADDHATEDLDRLNIVRIDRSPTSGASSEEDVFILPFCKESHCDALFWRRHGRGIGE